MSTNAQVTRAAGVVGFSTAITRVLGFLRDMVIARMLGAGMEADAYLVAFRIPNMLRRLVGEGALTISFIPVFVEERQQSEERAWHLANTVMTLLAILLVVMTVVGVTCTPYIIQLLAPGFDRIPSKFALTVSLTRITFPYIFFISLAALGMGILNSLHHFLAPALAPAMLNISLIASALLISPHLDRPVIGLAIGVLFGGMAQYLFQLPALIQRGFPFRISFDYKHPAVQKIGSLLLPAFFGLAITQISLFVDTLMASYLPQGSVTYLFYADRLVEVPLGVFGIAVATAVLPTMSAQTAKQEYDKLIETLGFAMRLVSFVTIPAMVALIVLRVPIITWLFERGKFTPDATQATAQAVLYYALGLFSFTGVRIVTPVFYALKDTRTPVKCGVIAVLLNITGNLLLMGPMKHGGLALATSISSTCNLLLLIWLLRKRLGRIGLVSLFRSMRKVAAASGVMAICCLPFITQATHSPVMFVGVMAGGAVIFFGSSLLLKSAELLFLKEMLRKRLS